MYCGFCLALCEGKKGLASVAQLKTALQKYLPDINSTLVPQYIGIYQSMFVCMHPREQIFLVVKSCSL